MYRPNTANRTMTPKLVAVARIAARLFCKGENFDVNAKNTGIVPGGSMMTNSVVKVVASSVTFKKLLMSTRSHSQAAPTGPPHNGA